MPENSPEIIFKNSENQAGQGLLRFYVLQLLLCSTRPVTVSDIVKNMQVQYGQSITCNTVYKILGEISASLKLYTLQYIIMPVGKSRARAFSLIKTKHKNEQVSEF